VTVDGQTHHLDAEDLTITHRTAGELVVAEHLGYVAAVDPALTPDLVDEGTAREVIRQVQLLRKESGLAVSDRIQLVVGGDADVERAVRSHAEWIAGETLAREVRVGKTQGSLEGHFDAERDVLMDGRTVHLALTKEVER
jgi:isoleucyl-tRNA synthetase